MKNKANPSLNNYTENNEWTLLGYKPYRTETKYENWIENDSFAEINYKMLIRRKSLFVLHKYIFVIFMKHRAVIIIKDSLFIFIKTSFVVPALMLCILTLVSFFIPFAQEMQIGISILLSFAVFKLRYLFSFHFNFIVDLF